MRFPKPRTLALVTITCLLVAGGLFIQRVSHADNQRTKRDVERVDQLLALSNLALKLDADMDRREVRTILVASGYQDAMTEYNDRFEVNGLVLTLDPYGKLRAVGPDWKSPPPWRR